jgi:cytoskeleton protein RodZ
MEAASMSDTADDGTVPPSPPKPVTAGGLLRQARQAQGLHIAALAAAIKVVPRKLELLESDQFDKLPDATFTRALAQTVCRALKIDAVPILALLPPLSGNRLGVAASGLNAPFRDRPGRPVQSSWASFANPALWIAAVLIVGALAVYTMPSGWLPIGGSTATHARADSPAIPLVASDAAATIALPADASASSPVVPAGAAASGAASLRSASSPGGSDAEPSGSGAAASEASTNEEAPPPAGVLQLHATEQSWVEVIDARGQSLIARVLQPGEDVGLDGVTPLKVKIGNAGKTQVMFRGEPIELPGFTRDNVARFELK